MLSQTTSASAFQRKKHPLTSIPGEKIVRSCRVHEHLSIFHLLKSQPSQHELRISFADAEQVRARLHPSLPSHVFLALYSLYYPKHLEDSRRLRREAAKVEEIKRGAANLPSRNEWHDVIPTDRARRINCYFQATSLVSQLSETCEHARFLLLPSPRPFTAATISALTRLSL